MFTGIIQAVGKVNEIIPQAGDLRLGVHVGKLDRAILTVGDSISVNGVCLTAVSFFAQGFYADVSKETLARTTFKYLAVGDQVNLEPALLAGARLGGHLVSGHVDGVGRIAMIQTAGRSQRLTVEPPSGLLHYIAQKGSICIDGVSLTVNEVSGVDFSVNIVPHTLEETTLGTCGAQQQVNLEVDLIARYLERLLLGASVEQNEKITTDYLAERGFIK